MNILFLNAFHYLKGGSETVYFNTAELCREQGNKVSFFALKWPENLPSDYDKYFAESKETRTGVTGKIANIINYFYHFDAADKLGSLIEAERPDVAFIHLIWGQLTPSVLKVLKKHNIPAILVAHDYRLICPNYMFSNGSGEICEDCKGNKFFSCVRNRCCRGSLAMSAMMALEQRLRNQFFNPVKYLSGIVYVSDFSHRKHIEHMPALADVASLTLHNFTRNIADEPAKKDDYFLFLGRLSREKGGETMIRAFAKRPDLKLKIAGTGPEEERLRNLAEEIGAKNIEFLGYITGEPKRKLTAEARFVIVPSEWYENNPMSVIESLSLGTPVIGANIGGIPEIITEGKTGYLFESGNPDSLCEALDKASANDGYEQMCRQALQYARTDFSPLTYYPRLIEFAQKVRAGNAPSNLAKSN